MPRISFSWIPSYISDKDMEDIEVSLIEPTVEYSVEIPDNAVPDVADIYVHVNNWLRGCGFATDYE
jgi:hypothetical protein